MCIIDPEKLAYWYLRLNGFLTIENFVVHPDMGSQQCTDIDLIAARFPHRAELLKNPMPDDDRIVLDPNRILIVLAEVKTGTCDLNSPWTNRDKSNIQRVLSAVGPFERKRVNAVSEELYNHGWYENQDFAVFLCCFGQRKNQDLYVQFPKMPQLIWDDILSFIHKRFREYEKQKCSHPQWDKTGKKLWDCINIHSDVDEFRKAIKIR